MKASMVRWVFCVLTFLSCTVAAGDFTGTIGWMEVWRSGNVAFTLSPAIPSCNGQVILNLSDPGLKSMFATILAAKEAGHAVRIYTTDCGPAEGYGGSYNIPLYIYPQ